VTPGSIAGSEDFGELATSAGVPCVYWLAGCADPALFAVIATPPVHPGLTASQVESVAERIHAIAVSAGGTP